MKSMMMLMASVAVLAASGAELPETAIDPALREGEYTVEVKDGRVKLRAFDERALQAARYHLDDLRSLHGGKLPDVSERRRPRFRHRITHSGIGLAEFPDDYLEKLARAGFTDITVFVTGHNRTAGGKSVDFNALIARAKRFGLGVYLYANSGVFAHPRDPGGREELERAFGGFAADYPGAAGLILVGESCQFPSKDPRVQPVKWRQKDRNDPRPLAGWFPCSDYPEWLECVKTAVRRSAPRMDVVFWSYNWGNQPEKERLELIAALPKDVTLMATYEMFEDVTKRNGLECRGADYSLSFAGPGRYFASEARGAAKYGLRLAAMSNTAGRTWDFGTAPYEPCPFQWKKRWDGLVASSEKQGLVTLVESHHYGWTPSFITELSKEAFTEGGIPFDEHIRLIAARDFGAENVETAIAAWKAWSEAIVDYVPTDLNQYGPFRIGPAYPFTFGHADVTREEVPVDRSYPQADNICNYAYLNACADNATANAERTDAEYAAKEIELLESMDARFERGAAAFAAMGPRGASMANLGHYLAACVRTALNVKKGATAFLAKDEAGVLAAAKAEYANATAALALVAADPALGYEPSMGYAGGVEQIRWKLARMEDDYGFAAERDDRVRRHVAPVAVVCTTGKVADARRLLLPEPFRDTLTKNAAPACVLENDGGANASILLDFGRELHGGIRLGASYGTTPGAKIRVRFGESVGEALADLGEKNATNDHSVRDLVLEVPRLGALEYGETGFRYVRLELVTPGKVPLEEVRGVLITRGMRRLGSFRCSDRRIERIWETAVRTAELCAQRHLWDGVKRDRLVWMGDTHPETKALLAAFGGEATVIPETLSYAASVTPPDTWMSTIANYTLWWIRNVAEWYRFSGDRVWLASLGYYFGRTVDHVLGNFRDNGEWGREAEGNANPDNNFFFLDHPTRETPAAEWNGSQALAALALADAAELLRSLGDTERAGRAEAALSRLRGVKLANAGSKQAAALLTLAGLGGDRVSDRAVLTADQRGVTTFFGYYMLEAMSALGEDEKAMSLVRGYWGGMLDMGATTFWEDFDLAWTNGVTRIDELPVADRKNVHGDNGRYCYLGYRNSLCHGWSAGPAAWLTEHVLGVKILEPGGRKIRIMPHLGDLKWAEGDCPTPHGPIFVRHERRADGTVKTVCRLPHGVERVE